VVSHLTFAFSVPFLPAKGNHKSMGRAIFGQMKVYNLETDFVRNAHVKRKHKLKRDT